jgi:hypothetical protein
MSAADIRKVIEEAEKQATNLERSFTGVQLEHLSGQCLKNIASQMVLIRAELAGIRMAIMEAAHRPK